MCRVLDIARLNGMQVGPGRFSARVRDPLCPWNEGVWEFRSEHGILQVEQHTHSEFDCDLSIQSLTALIFGTHNPGDFAIRGWGNPSPALQTSLREMFPPREPYLHEYF